MATTYEKYLSSLSFPPSLTVLITGASSGIGKEAAKDMARLGYRLFLAVRDLGKGEKAKEEILREFPYAKIDLLLFDASSLDSIASFIGEIKRRRLDIDAFYANAAIYRVPYKKVFYGFESQIGVNFVANYLLYLGLRPYLLSLPHKVKFILTSSVAARNGYLHEADFDKKEKYDKVHAYSVSKTGVNMLYEKIRRECEGSNIVPILLHPGVVYTPLIEKAYPNKRLLLLIKKALRGFANPIGKAALAAMLAISQEIPSSCFIGPRGLFHIAGYPKPYPLYRENLQNADEIFAFIDEKIKGDGN